MEEKKERIKLWMGIAMVIVALFVDVIEMFLEWIGIGFIFSPIISICASFVFWIWLKICSVSFLGSPKKLFTQTTTSFLEIIPGLDAIGGFIWTVGIAIQVGIVRTEDKGGLLGKVGGVADKMAGMKVGSRG